MQFLQAGINFIGEFDMIKCRGCQANLTSVMLPLQVLGETLVTQCPACKFIIGFTLEGDGLEPGVTHAEVSDD